MLTYGTPVGAPKWAHPERQSLPAEQFLAMLRFSERSKLAELPGKILVSGWDEFVVGSSIIKARISRRE